MVGRIATAILLQKETFRALRTNTQEQYFAGYQRRMWNNQSSNQCEFIWLLIYNVVTGMVINNLI